MNQTQSSVSAIVENSKLLGLFSIEDLGRLVLAGVKFEEMTIAAAMTQQPTTLNLAELPSSSTLCAQTAQMVLNVLNQHHGHYLPVVDEQNHFVGLIPCDRLQSLLRNFVSQLQTQVAHLETETANLVQQLEEFKVRLPVSPHRCDQDKGQLAAEALRQSQQKLSLYMEQIPLAVIELDLDCHIVDWNPAATNIFGYSPAEALGQHALELLVPKDIKEHVNQLWQALLIGTGGNHVTNQVVTKDGNIITCEWYNTLLLDKDGNSISVTSLVQNISDRINAESALQEVNEQLEQRVEERTAVLGVANRQLLEEIIRSKRIETGLRESRTRLNLINSISTGITAGMSVAQILETTVPQLASHFRDMRVTYCIINEQGILSLIHNVDPISMPPNRNQPVKQVNLCVASDFLSALGRLGPIVIENINQDPLVANVKKAMFPETTQASLHVPLLHSDKQLGLLSFEASQPHQWSEYEIFTLTEVADYLSIVLQEAHAQQERQRVEVALLQSQKQNALLATALQNAADAIEISDADKVIEYVNPAFEAISGYTQAEMIGKTPVELFRSNKHDEAYYEMLDEVLARGEVWRGNLISKRKDKSLCYLEATIAPVFDAVGNIVHFVTIKRDVTDRKRVEESLRLTQFSLDHAVDAAFWIRPDGKFIYVNKAACHSLGYSYVELLLMSISDIAPQITTSAWTQHWQMLKQQKSLHFETYYQPRQGNFFPVELSINYQEFNGTEYGFAFARDITARKQAEEHLQASLEEKELLLKEVHHRVKNNLQVISSIFSLQSQYNNDPDILSLLADSQNRIRSMALIHEKLYRSDTLARIDFADYIKSLVRDLFASYNTSSNLIRLHLNVDNVPLNLDTAIPCGLLINELISNCLKHAFPNQQPGEIRVDFGNDSANQLCLVVQDTGIGLPENWNIKQANSLGLRLVRALTRQLLGKLEVYNDNGAVFQITFPKP